MSEDTRAWKYYVPKTHKVLTSQNVIFKMNDTDEVEYKVLKPLQILRLEGEQDNNDESTKFESDMEDELEILPQDVPLPPSEPSSEPSTPPSTPMYLSKPATKTPLSISPLPEPTSLSELKPLPKWKLPEQPTRIQPSRGSKEGNRDENFKIINFPANTSPGKPDAWHLRHPNLTANTTIINVAVENEPRTYQDVLNHPQKDKWIESMQAEINQLNTLGTFELVDLPKDRKPIGSKWVYRIKIDETGCIARCKSCLVSKGYTAIPGIDYDESHISSPVVRMDTN
jgi:hypothetical protein